MKRTSLLVCAALALAPVVSTAGTPTIFSTMVNGYASPVATGGYTPGSGVINVASTAGIPALGGGKWVVLTATRPGSPELLLGHYKATDKTATSFLGVTAIDGFADVPLLATDLISVRFSAGRWGELTAATNVLEINSAPLASPAFTGTPTAPTPTAGDSSTKLATTAFVASALSGAGAVSSVAGRTGAVVLTTADVGGLGSIATHAATEFLTAANNLSDLASPPTARTSLGLGTAAIKAASSTSGTVASVSGTPVVGHLATFADTAGTIVDGGAVPAGGAPSIGGTVTGGTAGSLLYVGAGPVLAQDNSYLRYDPSAHNVVLANSSGVSKATIGLAGDLLNISNASNNQGPATITGSIYAGGSGYGLVLQEGFGSSTYSMVLATGATGTPTAHVWKAAVQGYGTSSYIGYLFDANEVSTGTGSKTHTRWTFAGSQLAQLTAAGSYSAKGFASGSIATKTAAYTVTDGDSILLVSAASGAVPITLGAPSSLPVGRQFTIKKTDATANVVTVTATIDGATNFTLATQNKYGTFVTDGTSWYVIGNN